MPGYVTLRPGLILACAAKQRGPIFILLFSVKYGKCRFYCTYGAQKVPPNSRVDLRVTFAQKPNLQKRFGLVRLSNDPDPRQQTDKCFASAFCLFVCLNTLAIRHRIVWFVPKRNHRSGSCQRHPKIDRPLEINQATYTQCNGQRVT